MPYAGIPARALILFGPPGSGKGTQAKLIKDCLGIPHISTGDMLRERIQRADDLGNVVKHLIDAGDLVTDDLVNQMVEERLEQADCKPGFILDGYPRTISQAETICRRLSERSTGWLVVYLKVDYNIIIGRIAGRRFCPGCKSILNVSFKPPKVSEVCDECGSALSVRDDDRESVVRRRLEAYEEQTRPLLEFFSSDGHLYELDGAGDPPPVLAQRICELVRSV